MWEGKGLINDRREGVDNRRKIGRNSQVWGCGGGRRLNKKGTDQGEECGMEGGDSDKNKDDKKMMKKRTLF